MGRLQDQITLDSFAALTATGNGGVFNLSGYTSGSIFCQATAVTGTTPTLSAQLQASLDGTNFFNVPSSLIAALTGPTAVGVTMTEFLLPCGLALCRFAYTVGGTTPSYTGKMIGVLNHP